VALLHSARYQQSLRRYQAQRVRRRDLNKGDLLLRLRQDNRGRHKLSPPWEGPYIVAKVLKPGTYKLANENSEVFTNAWNIQQLRRFYPQSSELFVHRLYSHFRFPEIIKKYALLVYFWEPSGPSRARMRTNTEVSLALPSAKPSLPRGLLRGEPPNVPKNRQHFFEKFPSRL